MFVRGHFETETPRTADPNWSPLVELDYANIREATGLVVVYRSAYDTGNEVVVGELLVPLVSGLMMFSARSRASTTGVRETVLAERAMRQGIKPLEAMAIAQEEIDDPRVDEEFYAHPLSVIRAAMRWLRYDADMEVLSPMEPRANGEILLPSAGCAVVLPPRYVLTPALSGMMSGSIEMVTRVSPPGASGKDLHIWRIPNLKVEGRNRQARLKGLAVRIVRSWVQEGATQFKVDAKDMGDFEGRTQVECHASFRTATGPAQTAMRWFIDMDGTVFRVAAGAPSFVPKDRLYDDIKFVLQSWRRIDAGD